MKKLTSVILVFSLMLAMLVVSTVSIGAENNNEFVRATSPQYLLSKFDKANQGYINGKIHGYMGDADGDGKTTVMDATEIQLALAQFSTISEISTMLADVDRDGKVTVMDATEIQLFLAKMIDTVVINHALYTPAGDAEDVFLHFDASTTGWSNFKYIRFHIWEYGKDYFYAWGSKNENATDNGDGIWSYNLTKKGITIEPGKTYCVIFATDTGMQTYDLMFDSTVLGDTAYCNSDIYENPWDNIKTLQAAVWKNQDASKFGPVLAVTSIGTVVGTCCPPETSPQEIFEEFLVEKLMNARVFSGKDDQTILDDTAKVLGLNAKDVQSAIDSTGVSVKWSKRNTTLTIIYDDIPEEDYEGLGTKETRYTLLGLLLS